MKTLELIPNEDKEVIEKDKELIKEVESTLDLNEAQTRKRLIDLMLKDAGWYVTDETRVRLEYRLRWML